MRVVLELPWKKSEVDDRCRDDDFSGVITPSDDQCVRDLASLIIDALRGLGLRAVEIEELMQGELKKRRSTIIKEEK